VAQSEPNIFSPMVVKEAEISSNKNISKIYRMSTDDFGSPSALLMSKYWLLSSRSTGMKISSVPWKKG